MAFGFPAYHQERCVTGTSDAEGLRSLVLTAVKDLGWRLAEDADNRISARVSINLLSWGERVLLEFLPDNSVSITSKCVFALQCFDWGKNRKNVLRLMERIQARA